MERKTKEDFPLVMNVKDVMEILGIGKAAAYELMESEGFPCIKIGRLKKVNRDLFFDWLNKIA